MVEYKYNAWGKNVKTKPNQSALAKFDPYKYRDICMMKKSVSFVYNSVAYGVTDEIIIKAVDSSQNTRTELYYKFDEGDYYKGLNISGIYMPNSIGTGGHVF